VCPPRWAKPLKLKVTSVGVLAFMPSSWHMVQSFDAATQAVQIQALLRAASGTCFNNSELNCTLVHQQGPDAVRPGVAMAQALG
jgi:hypothetical protein